MSILHSGWKCSRVIITGIDIPNSDVARERRSPWQMECLWNERGTACQGEHVPCGAVLLR